MASFGFLRISIQSMTVVEKERPNLTIISVILTSHGTEHWKRETSTMLAADLPCEDVLGMIVSQVHFGDTANGDTLCLALIRL